MSKQERNEGKAGISDLTVIALVTSVLMPPVGWVAGFKARKQIEDSENKFTVVRHALIDNQSGL